MSNEDQIRSIVKQELSKARYDVSSVPYHIHNNVDSPNVPYLNIADAPGFFCIATDTKGTTPVNLFNAKPPRAFNNGGAPYNFTITGVFLISKDGTAGNLSLVNNGNTVATIAKGTVAGTMVGATSLANVSYTQGRKIQIVSSSTGNGTVFVTFIVQR